MKCPKWKGKKMERRVKEELKELSKKAFGTSSKWEKLINQGALQPMQRERKAMVVERGRPVEKTFTDRKNVVKHFTVEEVRQFMLDILKEREEAAAKAEEIKKNIFAKEGGKVETVSINGIEFPVEDAEFSRV